MTAREIYHNRIELLQGTLDLLVLETLKWGAQHGYGISQQIFARSGERLQVETGSLYPALHRMERQGWIASEWRLTEQNQRAKFYQLTKEGKKQLARDRSKWEATVEAMTGVLEGRA
ncbi:MAG TPA: PadR family transcriptional regulator [Silvibacterium sp.]|jgi:transcriptional regulator|nr:PadR family transcriptional regulator [Silvibacterium sp.]